MTPTGSPDELIITQIGAVRIVRINRPEIRNALTQRLLNRIGATMLDAERKDEVRSVVITGTGDRAFCAGMQLSGFESDGDGGIDDTTDIDSAAAMDGFMRCINGELNIPLVGAANATAVGGGLELLLGCDVIIAADHARFGFPEVQRGMFAAGSGTRIGKRIPMGIASALMLTGDLIDATRAYEIGLVNEVVAADEVLGCALGYAQRVAANAPLGVAATKELLRLAVEDPTQWSQRMEHWRGVVYSSEDAQEGPAAFAQKRPPVWKGR